jgi:hypothetical protein
MKSWASLKRLNSWLYLIQGFHFIKEAVEILYYAAMIHIFASIIFSSFFVSVLPLRVGNFLRISIQNQTIFAFHPSQVTWRHVIDFLKSIKAEPEMALAELHLHKSRVLVNLGLLFHASTPLMSTTLSAEMRVAQFCSTISSTQPSMYEKKALKPTDALTSMPPAQTVSFLAHVRMCCRYSTMPSLYLCSLASYDRAISFILSFGRAARYSHKALGPNCRAWYPGLCRQQSIQ